MKKKTISPPPAPKYLREYPPYLRGPSQNRWGGQRTQRVQGWKGSRGAANEGRQFTEAERKEWARFRGYLSK
jgi:hypothetical protein